MLFSKDREKVVVNSGAETLPRNALQYLPFGDQGQQAGIVSRICEFRRLFRTTSSYVTLRSPSERDRIRSAADGGSGGGGGSYVTFRSIRERPKPTAAAKAGDSCPWTAGDSCTWTWTADFSQGRHRRTVRGSGWPRSASRVSFLPPGFFGSRRI